MVSADTSVPFAYEFNSDEDGDLWMHTDDPRGANCTVVEVSISPDGSEQRETLRRSTDGPVFPALMYRTAASAWPAGRANDGGYCHLEVTDSAGEVSMIGYCEHASA